MVKKLDNGALRFSIFPTLVYGMDCSDLLDDVLDIFKKVNWKDQTDAKGLSVSDDSYILNNNKKLGGILIEKKDNNLVIGVGINVNENEENLNFEINQNITSLKINTNSIVVLENLLANILNNFEFNYFNLSDSEILDYWNSKCAHINKKIKFHRNKSLISGVFKGLNSDGQAIIEMKNKIHYLGGGLINL